MEAHGDGGAAGEKGFDAGGGEEEGLAGALGGEEDAGAGLAAVGLEAEIDGLEAGGGKRVGGKQAE